MLRFLLLSAQIRGMMHLGDSRTILVNQLRARVSTLALEMTFGA